MNGLQANGLLSVATHIVTGVELAPISMADEIHGLQLGAFNVAGEVRGMQFGVVNVARKSDVSVGAVSLVVEGRTNVHVFGGSDGVASIAVQHGSRYVHNFYGGSVSLAGKEGFAGGPLIGIGVHAYEDPHVFVDVDALAHVLFASSGNGTPESLMQGRAVVGYRFTPGFAVFAGPFYDVLIVRKDQAPRAYAGAALTKTVQAGDHTTYFSPGLLLGVRGP